MFAKLSLLSLFAGLVIAAAGHGQRVPVDLELAFVIDASGSIDVLDFPLAAVCPLMARSGSSSPCLATSALGRKADVRAQRPLFRQLRPLRP